MIWLKYKYIKGHFLKNGENPESDLLLIISFKNQFCCTYKLEYVFPNIL